jgi:hypothetical protein
VELAIELTLTGIPAIRVDLEMPGITCPACRRPLVKIDDRAVDSDPSDALIDAFDAAGIAPG